MKSKDIFGNYTEYETQNIYILTSNGEAKISTSENVLIDYYNIDGSILTQTQTAIITYSYNPNTAVITGATEAQHGRMKTSDIFGNYTEYETQNIYTLTVNGQAKVLTSENILVDHNNIDSSTLVLMLRNP